MSSRPKRFLRVVLGLVVGLISGILLGVCFIIVAFVVCSADGGSFNSTPKHEWVSGLAASGMVVAVTSAMRQSTATVKSRALSESSSGVSGLKKILRYLVAVVVGIILGVAFPTCLLTLVVFVCAKDGREDWVRQLGPAAYWSLTRLPNTFPLVGGILGWFWAFRRNRRERANNA
ncbi:MAG: hypothetical protein ACJ8F7_07370 [Gemmataceae bacterium]